MPYNTYFIKIEMSSTIEEVSRASIKFDICAKVLLLYDNVY